MSVRRGGILRKAIDVETSHIQDTKSVDILPTHNKSRLKPSDELQR